jgi:hypothetical protein
MERRMNQDNLIRKTLVNLDELEQAVRRFRDLSGRVSDYRGFTIKQPEAALIRKRIRFICDVLGQILPDMSSCLEPDPK